MTVMQRSKTPSGKVRDLSEKDALYAMEFMGERLIKTIIHGGSRPVEYHLSPSAHKLSPRAAERVLVHPNVTAIEDGLFPGHAQTFVWQDSAA